MDSEGTSKLLGKENDEDSETFLAPMTEYVTPLAFSIHAHFGELNSIKSYRLNVIWSIALELIIQSFKARWWEQYKLQPLLPGSVEELIVFLSKLILGTRNSVSVVRPLARDTRLVLLFWLIS